MKFLKNLFVFILSLGFVTSMYSAGFGSSSKVEKPFEFNLPGETPEEDKKCNFLIGTASKTGSYFRAGTVLADALSGGKFTACAATTDGSNQNLDLLEQGIINIAFVQADAYNTFIGKNEIRKDFLKPLDAQREEYVQLIMRTGENEDNLQNKNAKVIVGNMNSGGAASWTNIVNLEPSYGKASVLFENIDIIALNKLLNKEVDGIIKTSHAKPGDSFVKKVNAKIGIEFVAFNDKDINDDISIGNKNEPVYVFKNMLIEKGLLGGEKVEVPTTKVLIVINIKGMNNEQRKYFLNIFDRLGKGLW